MRDAREGLVGRDIERRQLSASLDSAVDRRPVTVFIDGEAGVGKTSLISWLVKEAVKKKALVLNGACVELGGGVAIPYGALTDALRLFVRHEGPETAMRLSGRSWSALFPLISDGTTTAAAPAAAPESQMRIFGAVLQLSDRIGKRAPLVLIFEDIHWADTSTLDLIRYVTRVKSDQQLMLVCSHRPVATRHQLRDLLGEQDFQRRVNRIDLAPFNRTELDDFVAALGRESIAEDRLERYFELSEGNAYYAEQLVMADDPQNPDVEVPPSLREVMLARLGQLSDEAAEVVRIAAVAGRRVSDSLLAAATDLDDRSLERALAECVRQRVLISNDDAYAFQHALLRDTAYRDFLLPRTRKRIHATIANALTKEPGGPTRRMPELAYHWFEAGRLPEAFSAALSAAAQAVSVHAFPEAQSHYERALRLWLDIADAQARAGGPRERVLGLAADAARWANRGRQALQWVREAITEVDAGTDPGRAGELQERLGSYLWETGEYEGAAAAYREADRLLEGLPPSAVASRVQSALATVATRTGDFPAALEHARRAVELARAVAARAEEGRARNSLGLALALGGRIAEGEAELRAALSIAAEADHLEDLFRAYGNLGVCLEHAGRLDEAVGAMREGLAQAKEHGLLGTRQSAVLANNAAAALQLLGRYDEAAGLLDEVVLRRPVAETLYARLTRAEIHVVRGEFADAARLLEEIGSPAHKDPRFQGPLYVCLAEAAAWQGRLGEARDIVEQGRRELADATAARTVVQLGAVGLRIAADLRDTAWADELILVIQRIAADEPGLDETGLLTRQCHAERARADDQDTPEMWQEITAGWEALAQPFRKAYAQGRKAGAAARTGQRELAGATVREAYAAAEAVGAEPLRASLERLAHDLRLRLGKPRPYNLTQAELTVLRVLVTGATDAEIAKQLNNSPKTIGIHVGNILRKLGVRNRSEAADLARRERIVD